MRVTKAEVRAPQSPAAVAPYPALDAGTVIAQLVSKQEEHSAGSMTPPLESLLRSMSLAAAPAGADDKPHTGPGAAAGPSSRAGGPASAATFEAALNSCALAVLQKQGTLSGDGSPQKDSFEGASPAGLRLAAPAESLPLRPPASLSELLRQVDAAAAGSPPSTPHLHPGAAAPMLSVSLGAYSSGSPDATTPRAASACASASASASSADLAGAAALPARLLSERLQQQAERAQQAQQAQQACRPGLEAALAAEGAWPPAEADLAAAGSHSWSAPAALLLGGAPMPAPAPPLACLPPHAPLAGLQQQPGADLAALQLQDGCWAAAAAALSLGGSLSLPPPAAAAWPGPELSQLQALLQSQRQGQAAAAALHQVQQAHQARLSHPAVLPGTALPAFPGVEHQLGLPPGMCHSAPAAYPHLLSQAVLLPRRRLVEQLPPECLVGLGAAYQPYCTQIISDRLNEAAQASLTAVKLLQGSDPPAAARVFGRRYFCSLKEVSKVVPSARCLVVAPDVRVSPTAHINPVRALQRILRDAELHGVPVVFALSRKGIGQVFGRDKLMSIVALMNLEGLEGSYRAMLDEAIKGRQLFDQHRCGQLLLG